AYGVQFHSKELPELAGLPENVIPAGRDAAGNWWFFECAGEETVWTERHIRFAPRQIRKANLNA
ncbi:MAG: hypothetical protein PHS41_12595, partial [Victivallaceae bacterium]|nr:hypothetical protein [Victivallaceae bacterium]